MLKQLILTVCLFGVVTLATADRQAIPLNPRTAAVFKNVLDNFEKWEEPKQIETVDDIVEMVFIEARLLMGEMGLEPMSLPEVHMNFSYKPIIINYHGELDLTRGWAQHISEIYPNGVSTFTYDSRVFTCTVPFKFTKILFNYDYNMKLMGLGPDGGVEGFAEEVLLEMSISIDFDNLVVQLNKFEIPKIKKLGAKFTGNALLDWLVNLLTGLVTPIFKGLVSDIAESVVRSALVSIINALNEALGGLRPPPIGDQKIVYSDLREMAAFLKNHNN